MKLIATVLALASAPGAAPTATTSTSAITFADPVVCQEVLASYKSRGDHVLDVRGVTVTLRLVGAKCVRDDAPESVVSPLPVPDWMR